MRLNKYLGFKEYRNAIAYFVLSILLIMLFLPQSGKFKYEFMKGKVWIYEDLYAPFDFPIYKTETELLQEKQFVSHEVIPYYWMDTTILRKQLIDLEKQIHNQVVYSFVASRMKFVYSRGILPERQSEHKGSVFIVKGNESYSVPFQEIFSQAKAYEYIGDLHLNTQKPNDSVDLRKFVTSNLVFDEELTNKVHKSKLSAILPTKGMVFEGERVISVGEMITPNKFQILTSLKKEYEENTGFSGNVFLLQLGRFIFIFLCFSAIFIILLNFREEILRDKKKLFFCLFLILLGTLSSLVTLKFFPLMIYLVPITIVPVYISSFFYSRPALFIHFFLTLLIANFSSSSFEFVYLNSLAGVTAVVGFRHSYKRGQLFLTAFLIFASYCLAYISLKLLQEGGLNGVNWLYILFFAINSLTIIILFQFTFIFERMFGFVSVSRLIELLDTNHKLLRELSETAPGTFQHVMQVANLSEAVIREINGDTLLVRVGALYHDIGKMKNPTYFIENQKDVNPHEDLSPEESARIIIEHVSYGIELARKNNLPEAIIEFIRTHHANSKVYYFYSQFLDSNEADESTLLKFSYPGPCPTTKETGVVMMCDACEAASRSLKKPTVVSISSMVDKIIDMQIKEGYLNNCDITLKELSITKEIIKNKLQNIFHARIEYPERR